MSTYPNIHGKSGVSAYQLGEESITVQFQNGERYLYNYASAGKENIESMKRLAHRGKGLSTFISQYIKNKYAKKF